MSEVKALNIVYDAGTYQLSIYPALVKSGRDLILVDCGFPGQFSQLVKAIGDAGEDCKSITKILVTHQDIDHIGNLAEFKEKYPHIKAVASKIDAPYIRGEKKLLRIELDEAELEEAKSERKEALLLDIESQKTIRTTNVDIEVEDGDFIDEEEDCMVVSTPGHMPGHICLYVKSQKTIITGDAASVEDDCLCTNKNIYTMDKALAELSFKKLMTFDANKFILFHYGVFEKK